MLRKYIRSLLEEQKKEKFDTLVRYVDAIGPEDQYLILAGNLETNESYGHMKLSVLDDEAHILWVEVKPEHRRKGVATAIYARLDWWVAEEGLQVVGGMRTPEGEKFRSSLEEQKTKSYQAYFRGVQAASDLDALANIARKIENYDFESLLLSDVLVGMCVKKAKRFGLCGGLIPEDQAWNQLLDYHRQEEIFEEQK